MVLAQFFILPFICENISVSNLLSMWVRAHAHTHTNTFGMFTRVSYMI